MVLQIQISPLVISYVQLLLILDWIQAGSIEQRRHSVWVWTNLDPEIGQCHVRGDHNLIGTVTVDLIVEGPWHTAFSGVRYPRQSAFKCQRRGPRNLVSNYPMPNAN